MLEGKKDNITLAIARTSLVGDVAVGISWKVALSSCTFNKLKGSCYCTDCFPELSEEACVCYAVYLTVRNGLCGDPLATARSKVGSVNCGYHNGEFSISWKVKGTGSAVRKSLGIALKYLVPEKLYSVYQHCVKEAGGKSSREVFNYAAANVIKALKDGVHCFTVGNIKLVKKDDNGKEVDAVDIADMLSVLNKKLSIGSVSGDKKAPSGHVDCNHAGYTEIKVAGWGTCILADYISAKVKGLTPTIYNKSIMLPVDEKKWKSFSEKIKKQVKDFVAQKYSKLGNELPGIIAYMIVSHGAVGCRDAHAVVKSGVKGADVERVLSGAL